METLKQELESAQQGAVQMRELSSASEEALAELTQTYDEYRASTDNQMQELQVTNRLVYV